MTFQDRIAFKPDSETEISSINKNSPTEVTNKKGELGYMDDMEYHRVADALEIGYDDRRASNMAEKLSYLYDWAKDITSSDDRISRIEAIRNLQKTLGIQGTGPETIKKLFQYERLDQNRRQIERRMENMKNV